MPYLDPNTGYNKVHATHTSKNKFLKGIIFKIFRNRFTYFIKYDCTKFSQLTLSYIEKKQNNNNHSKIPKHVDSN